MTEHKLKAFKLNTFNPNPSVIGVRGEGWDAEFYLQPHAAIEVSGRKPTLEEFRNSFAPSFFPIAAIDALYVSVSVAFDSSPDCD